MVTGQMVNVAMTLGIAALVKRQYAIHVLDIRKSELAIVIVKLEMLAGINRYFT